MPRMNLKVQLEQLQNLKAKLQTRIATGVDTAAAEGKKVLAQLGAEVDEREFSIGRVVTQIREKNASLKEVWVKLDTATYDARKKLSWDAHMISAHAKLKAQDAYINGIKPKLHSYKAKADLKFKEFAAKAEAVKSRLVH